MLQAIDELMLSVLCRLSSEHNTPLPLHVTTLQKPHEQVSLRMQTVMDSLPGLHKGKMILHICELLQARHVFACRM